MFASIEIEVRNRSTEQGPTTNRHWRVRLWAPSGWDVFGSVEEFKHGAADYIIVTPLPLAPAKPSPGGDFEDFLNQLEFLDTPYVVVQLRSNGEARFAIDRSGQESLYFTTTPTRLRLSTERWELRSPTRDVSLGGASEIVTLSPQTIAAWCPGSEKATVKPRKRRRITIPLGATAAGRTVRRIAVNTMDRLATH